MSAKEDTGQSIKLTITMLVSNRKDTIRKCMDSIKPLLEQVASELIVVDTGSTDGSIEIVREYTDKIVPFVWCNDFSAARNAGLKDAKGEWVMFLDDDEWFEDVTEIVQFFNSGEYRCYNRGVYIVRNYGDKKGYTWSESNAVRMVKRCPVTAFRGKVHEYIYPLVEPAKYFKAYVHHYGYVFSTMEQRRKHSLRNITLLEEEMKQAPEDVRLMAQAVQEYFGTGEMHKVLELCQQVLERYQQTKQHKVYAGYCSNYTLRAYIAMEDFETAYQWGNKELAKGVSTSMALLGNIREMIKICRKTERYQEGIRCFKKYLELYDILSENVNREEILLDLSRYLQSSEQQQVFLEGIALGVLSQNTNIVEQCLEGVDWNKEPLRLYPDTLEYLIKFFSSRDIKQKDSVIFHKILQNKGFLEKIEENLKKYQDNEKSYKRLLALFGECKEDSLYIKRYKFYYHTLYANDWSKEEAEIFLYKMWEDMANPLLEDKQFWSAIHKNQLKIEKAIKSTSYARWFTLVRQWIEVKLKENQDIEEVYSIICSEINEDLRYQFLKLKYKEFKIRWAYQLSEKQNLLAELQSYSCNIFQFYSCIYQSNMFCEEYAAVLPPEGIFSFYIKQAYENREKGDIHQYLQQIAKAAKAYPGMKKICKELLQQEKEKQKNNVNEVNEFADLARQIKQNIRIMIRNGNYKEALEIIEQVSLLLPEDNELEILKQEIKNVNEK